MGTKLKDCMGLLVCLRGDFIKYFNLVYWHEGLEDEKFMSGIEKTKIINREIQLCGYFVIVTSYRMTARGSADDRSKKLFRGDKLYLGVWSERVYSNESMDIKIFIEFVATIIRSEIYTYLEDEMDRQEHRGNL